MKKLLFIIITALFSISATSQITRQNELFKNITFINNKIAFVKEVTVDEEAPKKNYNILKEWAKKSYGKDPFISSVRYDDKKNEILANSRIELILPENRFGVREKMVMRYRINGFLINDKCVLEITDLSFLYENSKDKKLPRVIRAEDFISAQSIAIDDDLKELRVNTKKSTLYFLNALGKEFEELFGYK